MSVEPDEREMYTNIIEKLLDANLTMSREILVTFQQVLQAAVKGDNEPSTIDSLFKAALKGDIPPWFKPGPGSGFPGNRGDPNIGGT